MNIWPVSVSSQAVHVALACFHPHRKLTRGVFMLAGLPIPPLWDEIDTRTGYKSNLHCVTNVARRLGADAGTNASPNASSAGHRILGAGAVLPSRIVSPL